MHYMLKMTNFCILYWDMGCETRRQNAIVSWRELVKMTKYLRDKGLKFNAYMFEFGNNFIFNDSIKITDPLEFYEKAKKNNLAINHHVNDNCDFIAIMDSDLFFSEEQYDMVYDHIVELENSKNKIFFTYNLMDIHENERKEVLDLEKIELNVEKLEELKPKYSWRHSWGAGVLGGIFIVPRKEIREMGGFNENFLTWGAEDDEAHTRIKGYAEWRPKMNQGPYHLWHPKNEKDDKYFIPVYSDEYFRVNKVEKPR